MEDIKHLPCERIIKEIIDFTVARDDVNTVDCMMMLKREPWRAVSMYESEAYPDSFSLPIAYADGTFDEEKLMEDEVEAQMDLKTYFPNQARAPEGEYELDDGKIVKVNMWGRVMNPYVVWDED